MAFSDQALWCGTSGGSANAQTVSLPNILSLTDLVGVEVQFIAGFTNTAAMTFTVGSLTAPVLKVSQSGLVPLSGGELVSGSKGNLVSLIYDGTEFVFSGPVVVLPILVASRSYYVNVNTGNDSNPGTSGSPFATIQKAVNVVGTFNLNGFTVTINVANGTYAPFTLTPVNGSGSINLVGNSGSPSSVLVSATIGSAITAGGVSSGYSINGFGVTSAAPNLPDNDVGNGFLVFGNTNIYLANLYFGVCQGAHIFATTGASVTIGGTMQVNGGLSFASGIYPGAHIWTTFGGIVGALGGAGNPSQNPTLTISGAVAIPGGWVNVGAGYLFVTYASISGAGSVTGPKYVGTLNGVIATNTGNVNYYPGSSAGALSTGAQYT